ncbi:MAG: ABC transporter permease [Xanthobacteraceae bacterium]|nr:ABC transporter permease [Xanthobacteraceae bacterium]
MQREGSPWQGLGIVTVKELGDHLGSARMRMLEWLMLLTAAAPLYTAITGLRDSTAEDPFLLLKLFTVSGTSLPSFVGILGFIIPLMAIGLGFDAINGEHNRRTLSRILAQPIYRDALLAGKFIASLGTLAISLVCLWLLVVGLGVLFLGVPPSWEEIARSLIFLVISIAYAGVWLAVAMLFSVIFRSPATAALLSLGVWLFMTLLWPMISPVLAQMISPPDIRYVMLGLPSPDTLQWQVGLSRLSPNQLYGEAVLAVLSPSTRALGPIFLEQLQGAVIGSALPLKESLMIAWPQVVGLIAGAILLFVTTYVVFQRQEVRA